MINLILFHFRDNIFSQPDSRYSRIRASKQYWGHCRSESRCLGDQPNMRVYCWPATWNSRLYRRYTIFKSFSLTSTSNYVSKRNMLCKPPVDRASAFPSPALRSPRWRMSVQLWGPINLVRWRRPRCTKQRLATTIMFCLMNGLSRSALASTLKE